MTMLRTLTIVGMMLTLMMTRIDGDDVEDADDD